MKARFLWFLPLDIFAVNNGQPKWIACAETLAEAMQLLRHASPGSYFVFSLQTGQKDRYNVSVDGVVSQVDASSIP
jgi:hypothetical protein